VVYLYFELASKTRLQDIDPELKHFNSHLKLEIIPSPAGAQNATASGNVEIRRNIPAQTFSPGVRVRKLSGCDEPAFAHPFEFIPVEEIPHHLAGAVESFIGSEAMAAKRKAAKAKRESQR
jgi:hypothetical protein